MTSIGFAIVLNLSFGQSVFFLLYVIFVDCLLAGLIAASIFWIFTNKYLVANQNDGDIEWGYAFDVHLNAFFPPLIILHFIQLFFYKSLISQEWFISRFLGNTFWLMALTYYIYITFLGYNCKIDFDWLFFLNLFLHFFLSNFSPFRYCSSQEYTIDFNTTADRFHFLRGYQRYRLECQCYCYELLSLSCFINLIFD